MYIALKNDYPTFVAPPNKGGLLTPWADRGVLMLNTCLTVRAHEAFSHANRGWERLTQKVIDLVAQKRTRGVVFMAWGTPAGKRVQKVDKQKHLVLQSVHPSPLSASRGFFECGHFRKANNWLVQRYGPEGEIDWALTPGASTKEIPAPEKEARDEEVAGEAKAKSQEAKQKVEATKEKENKEEEADNEIEFGSDDEAALEEAMKETATKK
jgi:uracil-DNA glycosylase